MLEGTLLESERAMREYITRSRAGLYAEPSTAALAGFIPAGQVLRGSMPSSRGWIALDDEESFVRDDGSLALSSPAPQPARFSRRVDMPDDADLEGASILEEKSSGLTIRVPRKPARPQTPAAYRVLHDPCVYVRESRSLGARPLGYKRAGEIVHVSAEVDGWLKLANEDGWMLRDGRQVGLGPLLAPVSEAKVVPAKRSPPTPAPPRTAPAR